ncbi:UDP-N-acetylmuramate dehydrogenase [Candidatus Omnitrophota bacterium]
MSEPLNNLEIKFTGIKTQPLSELTTFRCGGPSLGVIDCTTPEQVCEAVSCFNQSNLPFIVIGGGSNIVVSDCGLDCYVLRFISVEPLIDCKETLIVVSAGSRLDQVACFAAEQGLAGLNFANGIPGTVGGGVVGNAGAFGQQLSDVVTSIEVLTRNGVKRVIPASECGFSYRHSALKHSSDIVLSVSFKCTKSDRGVLLGTRHDILKSRREKHPDWRTTPCAGSFFRNVDARSIDGKRQAAGWFLEQAGVKTLRCGGASIFERHANIIVGDATCRAQDIFECSQKMKAAVLSKFNLELIREVRFVGAFDGCGLVDGHQFF